MFWLSKAGSCDVGGQAYTKVKLISNHLSKSLQHFGCYNLATKVVIFYIKGYDLHWLLLLGKRHSSERKVHVSCQKVRLAIN